MRSAEAIGLFSYLYDPLTAPLERAGLGALRAEALRGLEGTVLELGVGTGRNLPLYPPGAESITGIDPDEIMLRRARERAAQARLPVELRQADAEALPFADESFDAVAATLVFCTIPNPARALAEALRVLKEGGELRLLEHVRMQRPHIARLQEKATPAWKRLADGCHLDRDTLSLVNASGFQDVRAASHLDGLVLSISARKPAPTP